MITNFLYCVAAYITWKLQFFIVLLLQSSLYHLESAESIVSHRLGRPEGKANADSFDVRYVSL